MLKHVTEMLQEEARQAYERTSQEEAPQHLQNVMLAEIALQLAKQNEFLESIAGHLRDLAEVEAGK